MMVFDVLIFGAVFVTALGSSMAMLFAPNAVHVALFLVVSQIALAIAFLVQGAFFLFAIQIILYAGAIMVLFLFVIMLLGVDRRELLVEPLPAQRPIAVTLGAVLAVEIGYVAFQGLDFVTSGRGGDSAIAALNRDPGNVKELARVLFGDYLLPFEVTSVLLVAAIVGVMSLARRIGSGGSLVRPTERSEEAA